MERFVVAPKRSRSSPTDVPDFPKLFGFRNFLTFRYGSCWIELILAVDSLCFAVCDRSLLRPHSGITSLILAILALPPGRPFSRFANLPICLPKTDSVAGWGVLRSCTLAGLQVCKLAGLQVCKLAGLQVAG